MAPPTSTGQFTYTIAYRHSSENGQKITFIIYSNGVCIPIHVDMLMD